MQQPETTSILPLNGDQKEIVENLLHTFNDQQLTWLAGYLTGITLPQSLKTLPLSAPIIDSAQNIDKPLDTPELTVLYGSRTGNGASIAKQVKAAAEAKGFQINLQDMNEYPLNKLKDEKYLLVIVSTHGEGVPPIAAEEFYNFLHGKRAPKLPNTKFSVLALGDSSYVQFCQTGKDIDKKLEELGAERIYIRTDCDVDFSANATGWIEGVLAKLPVNIGKNHSIKINGEAKLNGHDTSPFPIYNKNNPFRAKLLERVKLNGRGSEKETFHYELSLEGSGLTYEPGDSVGVYGLNSQRAVHELINALSLNPDELVETENGKNTLEYFLTRNYEISTLNPEVITSYNKYAQNQKLTELLADVDMLKDYLYGRDVVDLVQEYPVALTALQLFGVLRKLQPRLYSISSGPNAHPDEVHLTIASVRYANSRYKEGVCSTFLADRVGDDDFVNMYIEKNPEFKLPSNPETPVIMIGPGTGLAPFRAFLEERNALGAKGKNWLFFGDRYFTTDFLYQAELQSFHKKGLLTRLNVAFSRDTDKKVYVQHKMLEHAKELFQWLEEGAHFYVCGDMKHMWNDVNKILMDIIIKEGGLTPEKGEEYLKNLKRTKRYQVDVY
jgi:sulfite reductase (NADPH) flavoprotein alpha-component